MNSKIRLLAAFVATSVSLSATASDGTINFHGEIFDTTCTISVDGITSPAEQTIQLPTVTAAVLSAAGETAGRTNFTIELSDCIGVAGGQINAFFEAGHSVDPTTGFLINSGTASNVQLRLSDSSGAPITAGDHSQNTTSARYDFDGRSISLPYAVEYIATGAVQPGSVTSFVTYSINYQ